MIISLNTKVNCISVGKPLILQFKLFFDIIWINMDMYQRREDTWERVELRMNEQMKYEIIRRVAFKEISVHRAAVQLNYTVRTVYNLVKKYREHGKAGFIHGNRNRKPAATMGPKPNKPLFRFINAKMRGANFLHFQELLEEIKRH